MISTRDGIINALGNNNTRLVIDKVSIASQVAGLYCSMWRATGQPAQGNIPTTATTCNAATLGTFNFAQQTAPATSYLSYLELATSNAATGMEIHDRLAHMGGLNGTLATAQTVGLDLSALAGTDNLTARIGDADYSDVQWWLEWYTATGAAACTAIVNVTYNDNSTGALTGLALPATRPASIMYSLNSLVPAAASGKFIKKVDSVTLSVTTGTAGNFGVTATKLRASLSSPIPNYKAIADYAQLGLPEIKNSSALFLIVLCSTTSSGSIRGGGKIIHG